MLDDGGWHEHWSRLTDVCFLNRYLTQGEGRWKNNIIYRVETAPAQHAMCMGISWRTGDKHAKTGSLKVIRSQRRAQVHVHAHLRVP